jgi:phage terminase Nu1 subunit (DNA packaging protein)
MESKTVSLAKLAALLDLTERRVQQLAKEGVLPKAGRGRYDPVVCIHAYIRYLRARADDGETSLTDERTKLTKIKREKAETELSIIREEFIHREKAREAWGRVIMAVRSRLLSIPTKSAPLLANVKSKTKCKKIVEEMIHEALCELANPRFTRRKSGIRNARPDSTTPSADR